MFNRSAITILAVAALTVSVPALADHNGRNSGRDRGYDFARVVDVEPIVRYVTVRQPRRECWQEEVYLERRPRTHRHGSAPATVAGGIIGGVIGRQFGGGSGRDAMTVVGTLIGSAIAHDRTSHEYRQPGTRRVQLVERCEVISDVVQEERIDGYRVTYVYNDSEYTTRMPYDPGNRIRVRVSITPVDFS